MDEVYNMRFKCTALFAVLLALLTGEPHLANKWSEKHVIVMDAGSTGSRVYIYKYEENFPLETIVEVAHMRVIPALSTFVRNSAGLTAQIDKLVEFAMTIAPSSSWSSTSICLKATAGLRSLNEEDQNYLISATAAALEKSVFLFDKSKTKVISGAEEALFDILAVTALFQTYKEGFITLGAADMGGSSQQIAFLYSSNSSNAKSEVHLGPYSRDPRKAIDVIVDQNGESSAAKMSEKCSPDWRIGIPGTTEIVEIFSKSFEDMGIIGAMDIALNEFYTNKTTPEDCLTSSASSGDLEPDNSTLNPSDSFSHNVEIAAKPSCILPLHPCLPDGPFPDVPGFIGYPQPLHGKGNFDKCHQLLRGVLVPQAERVVDLDCIKRHRPKVMVGMDNYPKALEILGIPQSISVAPSTIKQLARAVCRRPWKELLSEYPDFMPYRAQRACFGATYVYTMLVDIYGIEEDDKEAFLPVDSVGEHELSWALGSAVFSAMNLEVY